MRACDTRARRHYSARMSWTAPGEPAGGAAEAVPVAELRAFLRGAWSLERELADRAATRRGRARGRAVFAPDGAALRYREEGILTLGDYRGAFFRDGLYRFPTPARAEVAFADGRPFHDLDLTHGAWRACHRCGDDRYEGRFAVLHADAWQAVWRVTGPRKDWVLSSRFRRLPARP